MSISRKTVSIVLERDTKKEIRLICAQKEWTLATFFEQAMRAGIDRMRAARREGVGLKLRNMPKGLQRTSIWVDSDLAAEFDAAKGPGVFKRAVYYTAIHDYLEEVEDEL